MRHVLDTDRRISASWAALILGYAVLISATLLYAAIVYIATISFRQAPPDLPTGAVEFIRHVVLIPGLIPWCITAAWVATLHFGGDVPKGLGIIVVSIFIHYVVFAYSAHDDVGYRWVQSLEILFAAYCVRSMIRRVKTHSFKAA
jgi:hypothetical protein